MEVLLIAALLWSTVRAGASAGATSARSTWDRRRPDRHRKRAARRARWERTGLLGWSLVQMERLAVGTSRLGWDLGAATVNAVRDAVPAARDEWRTTWADRHPEPAETGQDSGTASEDNPRTAPAVTTVPGNNRYEPDPYKTVLTRQPNGNVRAEVFYTGAPELGEQSIWDDEFLSAEGAQRGAEGLIQEVQADHGRKAPATVSWVDRTVTAVPPQPLYGALTDLPTGTGPDPVQADDSAGTGHGPNPEPARGPVGTGVETDPVQTWIRVPHEVLDEGVPTDPLAETPFFPDAPEAIVNPMPYLDQPAGTDPDGSTTPTPITTGGTPMGLRDAITESANREPARGTATATLTRPTSGGEVDDLATLQRIAAQVIQQHEESEFMRIIRLCQTLPESADFGDRVGKMLAEFGQLCVSLGKIGDEVAEMAPGVSQIAGHVRGES